MFEKLYAYLQKNTGQSKYDYRGPSQVYDNKRLLLVEEGAKDYESLDKNSDRIPHALVFAGIDPNDKSRMLIK